MTRIDSTTGLTALLADQLDFHWRHQLRSRLAGITDDEYFWEPVPGCWTVHRDGSALQQSPARASGEHGDGGGGETSTDGLGATVR